MKLIMQIMTFVFLIPGIVAVLTAKSIVRKLNLSQKSEVEFDNQLTAEELEKYKFDKAVLNIKMLGMLIALPGFILLIITFK